MGARVGLQSRSASRIEVLWLVVTRNAGESLKGGVWLKHCINSIAIEAESIDPTLRTWMKHLKFR